MCRPAVAGAWPKRTAAAGGRTILPVRRSCRFIDYPLLLPRVEREARPRCARRLGPRSRRLALRSRHRLSVLARPREEARMGSAHARSSTFADLRRFGRVRGRMAARRTGAALGAARARRQAGLRVRDRRDDRHPEDAHRLRRLPHRLRAVQRDAARRVLPERRRTG